MADEVAHRGPSAVTVARVIARAGVSRRAFYELFTDVEDCLLATFEWAIGLARARVEAAYARERGWREGIRAALAALLRFFDENPLLAQLCVVHAAAGGPRVLERRAEVLLELGDVVDRGRQRRTLAREPSSIVGEGVVGAVIAVLYARLLRPEGLSGRYPGSRSGRTASRRGGSARKPGQVASKAGKPASKLGKPASKPGKLASKPDGSARASEEPALLALHGELMSLIVLPYLGANAAARELERPPPPPPIDSDPPALPVSGRVMLELPQGRLTYRTVRVLRAVAECPGGSNRDIARRAEIVDQGQISKILARLQEQDLLVNRGGSPRTRGMPNAWWLTERGESLERALRDSIANPAASGRRASPASAARPSHASSRQAPSKRPSPHRPQPGNGSASRRPGM